MHDDLPEWERELIRGHPQRPQRRMEELKAQAAIRRQQRGKITKTISVVLSAIIGFIFLATSLAVLAAIIGGAVWILTGKPLL